MVKKDSLLLLLTSIVPLVSEELVIYSCLRVSSIYLMINSKTYNGVAVSAHIRTRRRESDNQQVTLRDDTLDIEK